MGLLRRLRCGLYAGLLSVVLLPAAQAHLMVAQKGTLNLVGAGGFMVLSLPVSALAGIDDDGDGLLTQAELNRHEAAVQQQIQRGVQLLDGDTALPLQGVLLQLSHEDHAPVPGAAKQIVVLGRFALGERTSGLRLQMTLFGKGADERAQTLTVSHGAEVQRLLLTPERHSGVVLPNAWQTFSAYGIEGAMHVLSGLDHLLFLLVVLASGWTLRQTVLALSCFTVGHFSTLAGSAWLGWAVPSAIVEPAIAATIIGLALFDRWSLRRAPASPAALRLGLVFGASLVHGLGLAGALTDLGLDANHKLLSLAGFNLGIEAGQLAVALVAAAVMAAISRLSGKRGLRLTHRLASYIALAAGSVWLVQRVVVAA